MVIIFYPPKIHHEMYALVILSSFRNTAEFVAIDCPNPRAAGNQYTAALTSVKTLPLVLELGWLRMMVFYCLLNFAIIVS